MKKRGRLPFIVIFAATACIVLIAIRIEILNARAGYILPNDVAKAESRKYGGSGAWRATWMDEERWRKWFIRDERGEPDPRPLTAQEQQQMHRDIVRMNANYRLRSFVDRFGWVQYPLVLVVGRSAERHWPVRNDTGRQPRAFAGSPWASRPPRRDSRSTADTSVA
jgi:hypothetical protein